MKYPTFIGAFGLSIMSMTYAMDTENAPVQNKWTTTATWNGKTTTITVGDYTYHSGPIRPTTTTSRAPEVTTHAERDGDAFTFTYTVDDAQTVTTLDSTWTEPAGTFTLTISDGHVVPQPTRAVEAPASVVERDVIQTYSYDAQTVTELDTTWTVPSGIFTVTVPGDDGNKAPALAAVTQRAADAHTVTTYWTETATDTQVVPATTMTVSGTTNTFDAYTFINTWTKIVTTHITVPDANYPKQTRNSPKTTVGIPDANYPKHSKKSPKTTLETVVTRAASAPNEARAAEAAEAVERVCLDWPWACGSTKSTPNNPGPTVIFTTKPDAEPSPFPTIVWPTSPSVAEAPSSTTHKPSATAPVEPCSNDTWWWCPSKPLAAN